MTKRKVHKIIHPIEKSEIGDKVSKELRPERDHVAVLHFIKDEENPIAENGNDNQTRTYYASLPFISLFKNVQYPYRRWTMPVDYEAQVLEKIKALQNDLRYSKKISSPRSRFYGRVTADEIDPSYRYYNTIKTGAINIRKCINIDDIDPLFNLVRSLQGNLKLLQICTTRNIQLPWDWILCPDINLECGGNKLLCELFGVGVTYLADPSDIPNDMFLDRGSEKNKLQDDFHALIIGNSYPQTSRSLVGMDENIEKIDSIVKKSFGIKPTITHRNLPKEDICKIFKQMAPTLRLIVLSGHFDNYGFLTVDNKYLDARNIFDSFLRNTRPFSAKPFVLLNGCCSESGSSHGAANRSLADSFLKLGAEVCLVTSLDVRINPAFELITKLMKKLLEPRSTLGSSLLQARNDMDKDNCYEWAAYHIIGDPSYVLVES